MVVKGSTWVVQNGSYSCCISYFLNYLSIFSAVKQDRTGSQRVVCNKSRTIGKVLCSMEWYRSNTL